MRPASIVAARGVGASSLLFLAAVHANWATGSAWPAHDRAALARAVIGAENLPGTAACIAVASLLALASALVAGWPRDGSQLQRAGAAGVAFVLLARGAAGLSGVMPQERSPIFKRWNRRAYSPLCLALGALAATGAFGPA
jgi:Protein of unknown function (DUF3995)